MLPEAFQYLTTWPLSAAASRPFIRSSVNLWSRANRCAKAWASHEEASKAVIRDAIAEMRRKRTAVVLGSGLLRDVPIDDLAREFDTVVLFDLVHLASVRLRMRRKAYRNVRLIERDVSGYDDLADGRMLEPLAFLRQVPYLDLVVSANLLSQIGTGCARRLAAEPSGRMPADALRQLISAHVDGLAALPASRCLITDVSYDVIDRTGRIHETVDLLHGVPAQTATRTWPWPVVPFGEESNDYQVVHRVIASAGRDLL